jgi:putative oxidoreductase
LTWDSLTQRLFSTFPNHLPGLGLLLIRLSLGVTLIYPGAAMLLGKSPAPIFFRQIIEAAAGVLVVAGLWTPMSATLAALDQIWIALSVQSAQKGDEWVHILLAVLCASLAMLGPGAWSVDARLFGRRRFPSLPTRERKHPPNR